MSDLLGNDFNEEYFRFENNITTNQQEFIVNPQGELVYTTPLITDPVISVADVAFTNLNIMPQNINLIIDQIVLFSTNPDVQNYLPLKISFGDKPQIEFGGSTNSNLTNYQIITQPVNNQTVSNASWVFDRISRVTNSAIPGNLNTVISRNIAYFRYFLDANIDRYDLENDLELATLTLLSPVREIYANEKIVVAVTDNEEFYNLTGTIPPVLLQTYADVRDVELFENVCTVLYFNAAPLLDFWRTSLTGEMTLVRTLDLTPVLANASLIASYRLNRLFVWNPDLDQVLDLSFDLVTGGINVNREIAVDDQAFDQIEIGGSDLTVPTVSLFVKTATSIDWFFYEYKNGAYTSSIESIPLGNGLDTAIKVFGNTAYFTDSGTASALGYYLNLDNGGLSTLDNFQPVDYLGQDTTSFAIGQNWMIMPSIDATTPDLQLVLNVYRNRRPFNTVYKLSYNYDERIFPYQYTSSNFTFKLRLPNNDSILSLELFKYIIDFRIRYPKGAEDPNPAIPRQPRRRRGFNGKELQNRADGAQFTRISTSIGDVNRVLGYVDSDFNIADFLNLYNLD